MVDFVFDFFFFIFDQDGFLDGQGGVGMDFDQVVVVQNFFGGMGGGNDVVGCCGQRC